MEMLGHHKATLDFTATTTPPTTIQEVVGDSVGTKTAVV